MKNYLLIVLLMTSMLFLFVNDVFAIKLQKTITDIERGSHIVTVEQKDIKSPFLPSIIESRDNAQLLWQGQDNASITGRMKISPETEKSFVSWDLNNRRCALYPDYFYPVWQSEFDNCTYDFALDMLENGTIMGAAAGNNARVFEETSSEPIWEDFSNGEFTGLELSPDGSTVYIAEFTSNTTISAFDIETNIEIWTTSFNGFGSDLLLSGNGNFLVFSQYNDLYVLDANNGSEVFHTSNFSQHRPAISYDGSILVNGDFDGFGYVYQYNSETETYDLLWTYDVWGGGQYVPWVSSVMVSGDGNTIGMGSLTLYNDQFGGRFYMFDVESSTPIWSCENLGGQVQCIDMSFDGSTIAMGCNGPEDNSIPDFYLFKKESNEAFFTINSPGSILHTDISSDGTMCLAGGKAVHTNITGNGGTVYCVNIDIDPPAPENVVLESNENEVTISWEMPDITDLNYFNIYCSLNENEFVLLDTVFSSVFTYALPESGYYQFYITTIDNAEQESETSEIVLFNYVSNYSDNDLVSSSIRLYQNYPNPFNPSTTISFSFRSEQNEQTKLKIYNLKGQRIRQFSISNTQCATPHKYSIVWDGKDEKNNPVSNGIYLYKLESNNFSETKKMILIK